MLLRLESSDEDSSKDEEKKKKNKKKKSKSVFQISKENLLNHAFFMKKQMPKILKVLGVSDSSTSTDSVSSSD